MCNIHGTYVGSMGVAAGHTWQVFVVVQQVQSIWVLKIRVRMRSIFKRRVLTLVPVWHIALVLATEDSKRHVRIVASSSTKSIGGKFIIYTMVSVHNKKQHYYIIIMFSLVMTEKVLAKWSRSFFTHLYFI